MGSVLDSNVTGVSVNAEKAKAYDASIAASNMSKAAEAGRAQGVQEGAQSMLSRVAEYFKGWGVPETAEYDGLAGRGYDQLMDQSNYRQGIGAYSDGTGMYNRQ